MPTRRFVELSVLMAHPALWEAFPGGDLSDMPDVALYDMYTHQRAVRDDNARTVAREIAKVITPLMGIKM